MLAMSVPFRLALCLLGFLAATARCDLFLNQVDKSTWVFGNAIFNVTQGPVYATKVYYRGLELVGSAVGHYMGYGK
jgi:rhamnogalacturonan endolyase